MRYFYIICLVLSSFFIYNLSSADNIERQYAFFVPGSAYQENTAINNLDSIQPRYKKTRVNNTQTPPSKNKIKATEKLTRPVTKKPLKEIADAKPVPQIKDKKTTIATKQQANTIKEDSPIINTAETTDTPLAPVVETPTTPQLSEEELNRIKEKAAQYNIDDDDDFVIAPAFSDEAEQKKEKTINAMLSEIPYPNSDEPKFKQAFGKYGIALRTLYRQKTMPNDYEQDKILAKATSIKRFKVEAAD